MAVSVVVAEQAIFQSEPEMIGRVDEEIVQEYSAFRQFRYVNLQCEGVRDGVISEYFAGTGISPKRFVWVFRQVNHTSGSVNDDVFTEKAVVFYGSSVEAIHPWTCRNPDEAFLIFEDGEYALVA